MQVNGANWDVYGFDAVDQVTSVKYQADSSSGTNAQRSVGYDWDAVGNREQVQESTPSGPVLTDVYATANAVNQYPTINGSTVTHDGNGNLTAAKLNAGAGAPMAALGYDSQNRLLSVQNGSDTVESTYDTRNRLTSRTINGVKTLFLWDGWDLIEERDVTGAQVRRYVHGAAVDEILVMVDGQGAKYHVHDALGSVTGLVDENGAVLESYLYDVFGQVAVFDGSGVLQTGTSGAASGNRFLYTGREWIAEVGVYDYRNRVYSPKLGRFLQVDPIRFWAGDVNLYRYVGNGVVISRDPTGLLHPALLGAIGGAIWGGVTGGVSGGFKGFVSGLAGGAVGGFVLGATGSPALAGAASGALGGALSSAMNGNSGGRILASAAVGAGIGAVTGPAVGAVGGVNGAGAGLSEMANGAAGGAGAALVDAAAEALAAGERLMVDRVNGVRDSDDDGVVDNEDNDDDGDGMLDDVDSDDDGDGIPDEDDVDHPMCKLR